MKKLLPFLIFIFLCLSFVSAADISMENYYPTPAEAGDYFNVKVSITNKEDTASDVSIKFKPSYPFSLDPGEEQEITINDLGSGSTASRIFKVRVDAGAKEGDNSLIFQYKDCPGCVWKEKSMPIIVAEAQTMFDVVLQELNSEGVFVAIANIGKNPANAVTVRIPEQEYFRTDIISASIIGNLESGDYTLVGFQILPKTEQQKDSEGVRLRPASETEKELFIQIDYTDPLGIRRTITEKIMLNPSLLTRSSSEDIPASFNRKQSSTLKNIWFWISLILILVLTRKKLARLYYRLRRRF